MGAGAGVGGGTGAGVVVGGGGREVGGGGVVVGGDGQSSSTFVSVRAIVFLESYWEPSVRRSTTSQLK